FPAAGAQRLLLLALVRPIPDRSGIVEHQEAAITIVDRPVRHVRAAYRVQIELAPAAQGFGIAQHEAFEQRRLPRDGATHERHRDILMTAAETVARFGLMPREDR